MLSASMCNRSGICEFTCVCTHTHKHTHIKLKGIHLRAVGSWWPLTLETQGAGILSDSWLCDLLCVQVCFCVPAHVHECVCRTPTDLWCVLDHGCSSAPQDVCFPDPYNLASLAQPFSDNDPNAGPVLKRVPSLGGFSAPFSVLGPSFLVTLHQSVLPRTSDLCLLHRTLSCPQQTLSLYH